MMEKIHSKNPMRTYIEDFIFSCLYYDVFNTRNDQNSWSTLLKKTRKFISKVSFQVIKVALSALIRILP